MTTAQLIHKWQMTNIEHGPYTPQCVCNHWARELAAPILAGIDAVAVQGAPDGAWADGFRQGHRAAREAVERETWTGDGVPVEPPATPGLREALDAHELRYWLNQTYCRCGWKAAIEPNVWTAWADHREAAVRAALSEAPAKPESDRAAEYGHGPGGHAGWEKRPFEDCDYWFCVQARLRVGEVERPETAWPTNTYMADAAYMADIHNFDLESRQSLGHALDALHGATPSGIEPRPDPLNESPE